MGASLSFIYQGLNCVEWDGRWSGGWEKWPLEKL